MWYLLPLHDTAFQQADVFVGQINIMFYGADPCQVGMVFDGQLVLPTPYFPDQCLAFVQILLGR